MIVRRLTTIICLSFMAWTLSVQSAEAGRRWRFTPSVSVEANYNDDVQYLGKGDIETRISPRVQLDVDSERTEHTLTATLTRYKYGDFDELDRTTQAYGLETIHAATERLTLISNFSLTNDHTVGTSEEETGEVAQKTERQQLGWSGRAQYQLNERTLVGLQYGYSSRQYARDYVDTVGHSLSADINWAATERLNLLGAVSTGTVESEFQDGGSGDYRQFGGSVGFRYALTEIYTIFANVGNQWSSNDLNTGTVDDTISDQGRTIEGGVEWKFERSYGDLTYSRDTTTSLTGSTLDRDRINLEHNYRTTERSTLQLRGTVTDSKSDGVLSTTESRYWSAGATWRYAMTEDHQFWIGFSHQESKNEVTNTLNDRNNYFIRFNFAFPEEWTLGGARY